MNLRSRRVRAALCAWVAAALGTGGSDALAARLTRPGQDKSGESPVPAGSPTATDAKPEKLTDAERIARLQRGIAEAERRLEELRSQLGDPQSEYAAAEADFTRIDEELQEQRARVKKAKENGDSSAAKLEQGIAGLEPKWALAKERFDLAIKERKATQEQMAALEQKLQQDRAALQKLTEPQPATQPSGTAPAPASPPATPAEPPVPVTESPPKPTVAVPPAAGTASPAAASPVAAPGPAASAPAAPATASPPSGTARTPESPKLSEAKEVAAEKQKEATLAEEEVRSVTERLEALRKTIDIERGLLRTARQKADNAQQTAVALEDELQQKLAAGASWTELEELRASIRDTRERYFEGRGEIDERIDRLDKAQSELAQLQGEQIAAMKEAEAKRAEAGRASKRVQRLENPFAPQNVLQWLLNHGPKILVTVLAIVAIMWLARPLERHIVRLLARAGERGSFEERENRARTLAGVFHNALRVVVILGGVLMILAETGVNILPLMGGAAVVGLAVAFGAQNLLRDYFTGFIILLENQYGVNDVVRIGSQSGLVERITLRVTVLRDLDGAVHFIPNGHIATVTNMTHGWSRALFDIGIAYKEDVDRVMEVLTELGKELRRDPEFRGMILEQPEMLGVDQFGDSAVVIKFFIKTRPLKQWTVKREMLRRIKKKFAELGIEIPFPHRTVFLRADSGVQAGDSRESGTPTGTPNP